MQAHNGKATKGQYRVKLPDGRIQVVTYTADNGGYRADIRYENDNTATEKSVDSSTMFSKNTYPSGELPFTNFARNDINFQKSSKQAAEKSTSPLLYFNEIRSFGVTTTDKPSSYETVEYVDEEQFPYNKKLIEDVNYLLRYVTPTIETKNENVFDITPSKFPQNRYSNVDNSNLNLDRNTFKAQSDFSFKPFTSNRLKHEYPQSNIHKFGFPKMRSSQFSTVKPLFSRDSESPRLSLPKYDSSQTITPKYGRSSSSPLLTSVDNSHEHFKSQEKIHLSSPNYEPQEHPQFNTLRNGLLNHEQPFPQISQNEPFRESPQLSTPTYKSTKQQSSTTRNDAMESLQYSTPRHESKGSTFSTPRQDFGASQYSKPNYGSEESASSTPNYSLESSSPSSTPEYESMDLMQFNSPKNEHGESQSKTTSYFPSSKYESQEFPQKYDFQESTQFHIPKNEYHDESPQHITTKYESQASPQFTPKTDNQESSHSNTPRQDQQKFRPSQPYPLNQQLKEKLLFVPQLQEPSQKYKPQYEPTLQFNSDFSNLESPLNSQYKQKEVTQYKGLYNNFAQNNNIEFSAPESQQINSQEVTNSQDEKYKSYDFPPVTAGPTFNSEEHPQVAPAPDYNSKEQPPVSAVPLKFNTQQYKEFKSFAPTAQLFGPTIPTNEVRKPDSQFGRIEIPQYLHIHRYESGENVKPKELIYYTPLQVPVPNSIAYMEQGNYNNASGSRTASFSPSYITMTEHPRFEDLTDPYYNGAPLLRNNNHAVNLTPKSDHKQEISTQSVSKNFNMRILDDTKRVPQNWGVHYDDSRQISPNLNTLENIKEKSPFFKDTDTSRQISPNLRTLDHTRPTRPNFQTFDYSHEASPNFRTFDYPKHESSEFKTSDNSKQVSPDSRGLDELKQSSPIFKTFDDSRQVSLLSRDNADQPEQIKPPSIENVESKPKFQLTTEHSIENHESEENVGNQPYFDPRTYSGYFDFLPSSEVEDEKPSAENHEESKHNEPSKQKNAALPQYYYDFATATPSHRYISTEVNSDETYNMLSEEDQIRNSSFLAAAYLKPLHKERVYIHHNSQPSASSSDRSSHMEHVSGSLRKDSDVSIVKSISSTIPPELLKDFDYQLSNSVFREDNFDAGNEPEPSKVVTPSPTANAKLNKIIIRNLQSALSTNGKIYLKTPTHQQKSVR